MNYDSSTTQDYDSTSMGARDDAYEGRALVAAFADRDTAHAAAHALHDEGFGKTWIGVTHAASGATSGSMSTSATASGATVESDGDSIMDRIGRFFSGDSDTKSLYDELVRHGVAASEARRIEGSLMTNSAILTVDGHNHPELAAQLIEENGGHVLAGESFGAYDEDLGAGAPATSLLGTTAAASVSTATSSTDRIPDAASLRGSQLLGYGDASQYARGTGIDEERRLQLREERLSVDKQQVAAGEAQIGKEVVEHTQQIDVPVMHEELFVERRPVSETSTMADSGPIVEGETIRIPLMREEVAVTKRTVATGEVVIGKRQVTETQTVSGTTREEKLKVNDPTGTLVTNGAAKASSTL